MGKGRSVLALYTDLRNFNLFSSLGAHLPVINSCLDTFPPEIRQLAFLTEAQPICHVELGLAWRLLLAQASPVQYVSAVSDQPILTDFC